MLSELPCCRSNFLIEQARLVAANVHSAVIPGAGHWLMEESPEVVMRAIVAFVDVVTSPLAVAP